MNGIPTYFGKDPDKMNTEEIQTELIIQRTLASTYRREAHRQEYKNEKTRARLQELRERGEDEAGVRRAENALYRGEQRLDFMRACELNAREFISSLSEARKKAPKPKRERGYNPRKRSTKPKAKRCTALDNLERRSLYKIRKVPRTDYWNRDTFNLIARDRGYFTELAIINDVARVLDLPLKATKKLLKTGQFTWEQVLMLGELLEMEPREFCDTFLRDYFQEIGNTGYFVATDKRYFERRTNYDR